MVNARPGHCKFCGEVIKNSRGQVNKRATWHPACALTWTIMNNPSEARRFVWLRDRGVCRGCGKDCHPIGDDAKRELAERIMTTGAHAAREPLGEWEVDHIIPLSEATRLNRPAYLWQLSNMMTLCCSCHVRKTQLDRLLYGDDGCYKVRIVMPQDALEALEAVGFAKCTTIDSVGQGRQSRGQ